VSDTLVLYVQSQGNLEDLKAKLAAGGLRGDGFSDPRVFLPRLKGERPLACLFDMSFDDAPIMLAIIKSVRGVLGPALPLIAIVPSEGAPVGAQAIAAGASALIAKPLDEDDLLDLIASHVVSGEAGAAPELPQLIRWFFDKMAPVLAGIGTALCIETESEGQVAYYEQRLRTSCDAFIAMISAIRKTETKADLTQAIRMYGLRNARNLVVALKLSELTGVPLVQWNTKTGGLIGDPAKVLKFAIKTVEHFGEGSRNQEQAFNAGLVLDLLYVLAESAGARKAAIRKFMEDRFIEQMRRADKGIAAGKRAHTLALERHITTALLMELAGEVAMAIYSENYLELRRKFEKKSLQSVLQHIVELRQFSVSRNLMSALICQGSPSLDEASRAVLFFDYPYLLGAIPGSEDSLDLVNVSHTS
jgi:CheY-like chemotaxis protein